METIPASAMKLFMAMALLSLTTTVVSATHTTKPQRFVTKLIHRDSILSPYYKPNATVVDRAIQARERSIARLRYLARTSSLAANDDIRAGIISGDTGSMFMVSLSIGEPPVVQLLTMDTGSNLLWVQCEPCIHCFEQYSPIFDASKSSTYKNLTCNSPYCTVNSPKDKCDALNNCKFSHGYLDTTVASGILGTEKLTFSTTDEGTTSVPDMVFGCAYDNDGFSGQPSGILGLGPTNISLVTKLGSKFSYCIGNINDPKYAHNLLVLGDNAIIQGDSTPLEVFNDFYYLTMESISVGARGLNIDPKVFQRDPEGKGGVVIDSGTTLSFLAEGSYRPLSDEVRKFLDGKLQRVDDPDDPANLCYKGDINRDLTGFPVVTLHFAGGAEFGLEIGGLFQENGPGEFCMAVRMSNLNGLNVIGAMAQQNYNVAYDLAGKNITIERIDCQLLES